MGERKQWHFDDIRGHGAFVSALTGEPRCDRCGQTADADRLEVTRMGDPERRYAWGHITCTTPGCVDEDGSTAVLPPDEPGQLTREDRKWLKRHRRLAEEYGQVERALMEAM